MYVSGQIEQSEAEQSYIADPTFEVEKTVGMTVAKAVGKAVGMTIGKAVEKVVKMTVENA